MNIQGQPPVDFRPFNIEHAKAGAPYGLSNGHAVRIICFDAKLHGSDQIIILIKESIQDFNGKEYTAHRPSDGRSDYPHTPSLVMLPLAYIDEKPIFVGDIIQSRLDNTAVWGMPYGVYASWKPVPWLISRFPPKKVTKEIWQNRHKTSNGAEFFDQMIFDSKEEAENDIVARWPFVRSELISTYEVEE